MNSTANQSPGSGNQGYTILEMVISMALMLGVMGGVVTITKTSQSTHKTTKSLSSLTQDAHRALERISRELLESGPSTMPTRPTGPSGSSTLTYRTLESFTATGVIWGVLRTMELRDSPLDPDDGLDNDANGLIDEKQIVLVTDVGGAFETTEILARNVRKRLWGEISNGVDDNGNGLVDEPGLCFLMHGDTVGIHLTLEAPGPGGVTLRRTLETSTTLRN